MKQLSLLIIVSLFLPVVALAAFNEVSLTTGATLKVGDINLTVTNGTVERVDVYTGSLDITLAGGSSVDLTSADKYTFSYTKSNAIVGFTCGSSSSSLGIALAAGQTTETVSVSPSATVCQAATSGGGGPTTTTTTTSSTPSTTTTTSSTPSTTTTTAAATPSTTTTTASTPVATTPATTPPVASPPVTTTPAPVTTISLPFISRQLNPGMRSDEVMKLQELLAEDPELYPEGIVSGFYGPKTTAAVKRFQAKYGIATVGRVGPQTLAKINEVFGESVTVAQPSAPVATSVQTQTANQIQSQIQAIQQQIQALTGGTVAAPAAVSVSGEFISGLKLGSRNAEVKMLQQVLNSDPDTSISASGVGSAGRETTYFGPATRAAVQKFQVKYGIAGPGDAGYGYVGPATRAKLNEVFGGADIPLIPSPPVTPESPSSVAPTAPVTATSDVDALTKQIEDQIKTIQAQIDALLKK